MRKFHLKNVFMAPKSDDDGGSGAANIDIEDLKVGDNDPDKVDDKPKEDRGDELPEPAKAAPKKKKVKVEVEEEEEEPEEEEEEPEEPEEEEEVEEEEETEPAKPAKDPNKMVPIQRMDRVKAKRDQYKAGMEKALADAANLQQELDKARANGDRGAASKEFSDKVDALYTRIATCNAEADIAGAAKAMRELDDLKEQSTTARAQYIANMQAIQVQETIAYNAMVDQVELLVPELNPNDDDFDEELLEDVGDLVKTYEAKGIRPADALKKAVIRLVGKDAFEVTKRDLKTEKVQPKKTDIAKNVAAAKKTPPDAQRGVKKEEFTEIDASKLSDEEFKALPESKKKQLRGDYLPG